MTFDQLLAIALTGSDPYGKFDLGTISRLDRLGAFNGLPALRFIATTAVKSGITDTLFHSEEIDGSVRHEIERFIAHTGFRDHLATGFFDAYTGCLARFRQRLPPIPSISALHPTPPEGHIDSIAAEPQKNYPATAIARPYCASPEPATSPVIAIDRKCEQVCGATIDNAVFDNEDIAPGMTVLHVTLRRIYPIGSGTLHYTFHDHCGAIVASGIAATMTVSTPSPLTARIPLPAGIPVPDHIRLTLR